MSPSAILYQWHPSRKASCLDDLLGDFTGFRQTDPYPAYDSWADDKPGILRLSCWAHAPRKFHEAFKLGQALAANPLPAIQGLYHIEADLRRREASPGERARVRQEQVAPLLRTLKADLLALRQRPEVLLKSLLGKAIDYTLALWERLTRLSGPRATANRLELDRKPHQAHGRRQEGMALHGWRDHRQARRH